jgi:L,D-transpeptidase catalytic domain
MGANSFVVSMSVLRKLSVMYLLSASAFGVMLAFDRDPALEQVSRHTVATALDLLRGRVVQPAVALARGGSDRLATMWTAKSSPAIARNEYGPPVWLGVKLSPHAIVIPTPAPLAPPQPRLIAPDLPDAPLPDVRIAAEASAPNLSVAPSPPPELKPSLAFEPVIPSATSAAVSPAELVRVTARLKDSLTPEMLQNFGLFLYVSKADSGPWAQHMYVFRKDAAGDLTMLYNWPASTGRERIEIAANGTRQPSFTPQGYYQLDPDRMYRNHYSAQWHEPMPHAMFFNWQNNGLKTGLAIHGAVGPEVAQLGTRASAGCIRIAPEHAQALFNLVRTQYRGLAPRFAYDRNTATLSNTGVLMHDADGNLSMADGYKVLVFVENYGGANVVAALF